MKYQLTTAAAALLASTASAWGPGGPWGGGYPSCSNDCANQQNWATDPKSWCNDSKNLDDANSCISSSSCSDSDKETAYDYLAVLCANAGATVTAAPEATFSATSGSPWPYESCSTASCSWTTTYTSGQHYGPGGWGPWGPNNWGPWTTNSDWDSGAWTSWWGTTACPPSTWTGWTTGPWSTHAPWTTWSRCTASTTATSTFTTTVSGSVVTSTEYGIQVAQATGSVAGTTGASGASGTKASAASASGSTGAAKPIRTAGVGVGAAVGAAMLGFAVAL